MKYLRLACIGVAMVSLFLLYATLPMAAKTDSPKFNTPDETINYFFTRHLASTGSLAYHEPLNAVFSDPIVFMRWMQSPGVGSDVLYPGTFVGFIVLAGSVAALLGIYAPLFVTPILGIGCVLLMYWITRNLFGHRVGLWAAFMLAFLPPFFYYASRTMFHTVPFLFFVLLGVAAYVHIRASQYSWWFVVLSAFGFGGALFIRFADIWWIGLVIFALMLARPIGWRKAMVLVSMLIGSVLGNLALYHVIYGSWLTFGYPIAGFSVSAATTATARLGRFILPFGLYPQYIWPAVIQTLWQPYSGFIIFSVLGGAVMAVRYWTHHRRAVLVVGIMGTLVSCYMLALYGSWSFSDSPTPGLVTIGSSYTRYFLPLLVLLIPGAAFLLTKSLSFLRSRALRISGAVVVILILTAQAWSHAWAAAEGLAHVMSQTRASELIVDDLRDRGATPADIFLVRRGEDKMIFPDFPRVINVDYLPEDMVRKNLANFSGTVWISDDQHYFKKENPYRK